MTDDQDFIASIELSTSAAKMVLIRFDKWRAALDAVIQPYPKQPRLFSRELKEKLFLTHPTCTICSQHISELDDAAVDHIEQYWTGGKTSRRTQDSRTDTATARPRTDQVALHPAVA